MDIIPCIEIITIIHKPMLILIYYHLYYNIYYQYIIISKTIDLFSLLSALYYDTQTLV